MVKLGATMPIAVAALALTLVACAAEPRCEPVHHCDVRTEACQQKVLRHAACLRGEPEPEALSFPVRVMSRSEYIAQAGEEAAQQSEERAKMMRGLALFGFLRDDGAQKAAEDSARLVGAYYDSDTRSITVLDDGRRSRGQDVVTLVHEMVHALQDAAGQLSPAQPLRRFDQALAYDAIVEGEANLLEDESSANGYGYAFEDLDYAHALARYRRSAEASALRDDYPFATAGMRFPYAFGGSYLWSLRRREGPSALASAFEDPPSSTRAVIGRQPARWPDELGSSAVPALSDQPELSQFTLVGTYHLGRFLYQVGLRPREGRFPAYSLPSPGEFVADTFSVFGAPNGRVLAVYRVRFADDEALRYVAESIAEQELDAWIGIDGRDLWWAEAEEELPPMPSELRWEPAPESDFGFADEEAARRRIHCLHREWRH